MADPHHGFADHREPHDAEPDLGQPHDAEPHHREPDLGSPTTQSPTTESPTTQSPTTQSPTTQSPTTASPTSASPTSASPTTASPTTESPTSASPTSASPTTASPTSASPTSASPSTTESPTSASPTTESPTSASPTSASPTSASPTSASPTSASPTSASPTSQSPTTNFVPLCDAGALDLVFQMDSSGSMATSFGEQTDFAKAVTQLLAVGPAEVRVAAATHAAGDNTLQFDFDDHPSKAGVLSALDGVVHPGTNLQTNLGQALSWIVNNLFVAGTGFRGDPTQAAVIVFTDDATAETSGTFNRRVTKMVNTGAKVIAIGMGPNPPESELQGMANPPELFFRVAGPAALNTIVQDVANALCPNNRRRAVFAGAAAGAAAAAAETSSTAGAALPTSSHLLAVGVATLSTLIVAVAVGKVALSRRRRLRSKSVSLLPTRSMSDNTVLDTCVDDDVFDTPVFNELGQDE